MTPSPQSRARRRSQTPVLAPPLDTAVPAQALVLMLVLMLVLLLVLMLMLMLML